jgi:putative ABC transport system permease protein
MLAKAGLRNLLRNPRRTLGVVLAVAIGTGSLFLVHGFNAGIMNQYRYNAIHGIFGDGEVRTAAYAEKVHERPWEHWIPDRAKLEAELAAVPGVQAVFPRTSFMGLLSAGDHVMAGAGIGVNGEAESRFFTTINLEQGRDLEGTADGMVLGRDLAHALGVGVGDRVTVLAQDVHGSLNGEDFHVTGIFHTGKQSYDATFFRVQIAKVEALLDTPRVERMQIGLREGATFAPVAAHFPAGAPFEAVPFEVLDAAQYGNTVRFLDAQFQIIRIVVLIVVVLGLTSVLAASVLERRTEIGTLRANGESHGDIVRLLAVESAAMGVLGGLGGILYGLFVVHVLIPKGILMPAAPGLTRQFMVRIELQPDMAAQVVVIGAVVVLAASYFAIRRVLRASVAELLRSS